MYLAMLGPIIQRYIRIFKNSKRDMMMKFYLEWNQLSKELIEL